MEATKNICGVKCDRTVDHSIITRWFKKFASGCKNFGNQAKSGKLLRLRDNKHKQSIRRAWHLTVKWGLPPLWPWEKHL